MVGFHDPAGDGQAEARALSAAARSVGSIKPVEHPRKIHRRDARTLILYPEFRLSAMLIERDADVAAIRTVFERVIEQDHEKLTQPIRVS